MTTLLELGALTEEHPRCVRFCNELLRLWDAAWTFTRVPGLQPTNNLAERSLRHAVIWRKTSFGTQSVRGALYVERMLTVVGSLRLQRRNVLEYLVAAESSRQCMATLRHRSSRHPGRRSASRDHNAAAVDWAERLP